MTDKSPSRKWTPEEQQALRVRMNDILREEDMTRTSLSRESGIPYGTVTSWLNDTYAADGSNIAEKLQRWVEGRGRRNAIRATLPSNQFVLTPTAEAIHELLTYAKSAPDMVTVTGRPGTGKTSAVCEFTRRNPAVYKLVAEPSVNTVRTLLTALANMLGCYSRGSQYGISRAIAGRLHGTGGLLIIDEAQHLSSEMLDQLRAFHDQSQVGIALVGNEAVVGRIDGGRRSAEFAQLSSRVGMRMTRPRPLKADILSLLDAWGVDVADVRAELYQAARRPGGLRVMQRCHRLAQMLANAETRPISLEDVRIALSRQAAAPTGDAA